MKSAQEIVTEATEFARRGAELGFRITRLENDAKPMDEVDFGTPSNHLKAFVDLPVMADVQLLIDCDSYFAHKKTLAASSKYFEAMFNSGFKESNEFSVTIELPVVLSKDQVLLILEYAYTGSEARISKEVSEAKISMVSCLLNIAVAVEYLHMDALLAVLHDVVHALGPSYFQSQVGWKETTKISNDFMKSVLTLCMKRKTPLRIRLEWLELPCFSKDRPHGWDVNGHSKALQNLIEKYVVPDLKMMRWRDQIPDALRELNPILLDHVPMSSLLPSIQTHVNPKKCRNAGSGCKWLGIDQTTDKCGWCHARLHHEG